MFLSFISMMRGQTNTNEENNLCSHDRLGWDVFRHGISSCLQGYRLDVCGFWILAAARDFSPATQALGPTKLLIQWSPGGLSPEIKQPWCEADHPPLSSAKVTNVSSYNSRHPNAFMAWTWSTLPFDKGTTSHTAQSLKGVITASKVNVHNFFVFTSKYIINIINKISFLYKQYHMYIEVTLDCTLSPM